jgi:chromosome segregation ATPase
LRLLNSAYRAFRLAERSTRCAAQLADARERLRSENDELHAQLQSAELQSADLRTHDSAIEDVALEADALQRDNTELRERVLELEEQLKGARLAHRREVRQKASELSAVHGELSQARAQMREMRMRLRDLHAVCFTIQEVHVCSSSHAFMAKSEKIENIDAQCTQS